MTNDYSEQIEKIYSEIASLHDGDVNDITHTISNLASWHFCISAENPASIDQFANYLQALINIVEVRRSEFVESINNQIH